MATDPSERGASMAATRVTLRIDPEPLQEVSHWGIATQNRPDWGPEWAIVNYPESLEALYDDLGATIVRFGIDYRTYDDIKAREALRDGVLAATSRGMAWYGLPWSPPTSMKTIDHPNGTIDGQSNRLTPGRERDVARWLVDLVLWLKAQGVPEPVALSPQNEPDFGPSGYPGCIYTADQLRTAVIALREELDAAGLKGVKVVADEAATPAGFPHKPSPDRGTLRMAGIDPNGAYHSDLSYREALGAVATHTYDLHNNLYRARPEYMAEFAAAVDQIDIPVWMTEWETRHEHTHSDWEVLTETLRHFNRDMSEMRFNAWMHWQCWASWHVPAVPDSGEAVLRIRPGDVLVFDDVRIPPGISTLKLRYGSDSRKVTASFHLDSPDSLAIGRVNLSMVHGKAFRTDSVPLDAPAHADSHQLFVRFTCPEHWREASLNWLEIGGQRIEAESLSDKQTVEHWTSKTGPAFHSGSRRLFVHDNGHSIQRRPLYYVLQKVWTNAPAGGGTFVHRVKSDRPSIIRGATDEAIPEAYRQDTLALVCDGVTTMVVLNDHYRPVVLKIAGLTGGEAAVYTYTEQDASTVEQGMPLASLSMITEDGETEIQIAPQSLHVIVAGNEKTKHTRD